MVTVHAPSSLERASQIALVLAHHELWSLVEVLDLGRLVPFHLRRSAPAQPDNTELHTPPEQLRTALEELTASDPSLHERRLETGLDARYSAFIDVGFFLFPGRDFNR